MRTTILLVQELQKNSFWLNFGYHFQTLRESKKVNNIHTKCSSLLHLLTLKTISVFSCMFPVCFKGCYEKIFIYLLIPRKYSIRYSESQL